MQTGYRWGVAGGEPSQSPTVTALPEGEPRGEVATARVCREKMGNGGRCLTNTYAGAWRTLSVTFGDSSPRGRAKGEVAAARVCREKMGNGGCRCPMNTYAGAWRPSQSPTVTALPEGEPRGSCDGAVCGKTIGNGARLHRYALLTVLRAPR